MNIKYSKRKQELREDPVMELLAKGKALVTTHTNAFLAVVVIVAAAIVGSSAYRSMRETASARAQDSFGKALVDYTSGDKQRAIESLALVVENHGNSEHAAYSAYLLGTILVGEARLEEAVRWFEMARSSGKKGNLIRGASLEALGTTHELQGDLTKATEYFTMVLKEEPVAHRRPAIRWKLALIGQQQGSDSRVEELCEQIIADSLAVTFKEKAQNLLTEIRIQRAL